MESDDDSWNAVALQTGDLYSLLLRTARSLCALQLFAAAIYLQEGMRCVAYGVSDGPCDCGVVGSAALTQRDPDATQLVLAGPLVLTKPSL